MVTHDRPWQVWRLRRGVPTGHVVSCATEEEARAEARARHAELGHPYCVVDITRPALGQTFVAARSRDATGGALRARDLADLERIRTAAPGTTPRQLGLDRRRAHRLVRALSWGHLGTRERGGYPIPPAYGPNGRPVDVQLVLHRRGWAIARDGQVEDLEPLAVRLVVAQLAYEQCEQRRPSLRALRVLLGWSLPRCRAIGAAAEDLGWATRSRSGALQVSPAGRARALASLEHVAVAPIGGAA